MLLPPRPLRSCDRTLHVDLTLQTNVAAAPPTGRPCTCSSLRRDQQLRFAPAASTCGVTAQRWRLEIMEREPGTHGFRVQPRRWVVARSFAWLSRDRRLAKDYEREAQTCGTLIELAAIRLVLRRLGNVR